MSLIDLTHKFIQRRLKHFDEKGGGRMEVKMACAEFVDVLEALGQPTVLQQVITSDGVWIISATMEKGHDGLAKKSD